MRNKVSLFLSLIGLPVLVAGCIGPEQKFGRGFENMTEFARLGEIRRSMEQSAIFDIPGHGGMVAGLMHGINRSFERTGYGIYEVLTAPIPNGKYHDYGPIFFPADPVYPDSYKPDWIADTTLAPDTSLGFAGGDIAPFVPGSRFRIFDN